MEAQATPVAQAFEDFFLETNRDLTGALWLVTRNSHEAEEIAQDAYLKVWERWPRVGAMEDPTGYLHRTAWEPVAQPRATGRGCASEGHPRDPGRRSDRSHRIARRRREGARGPDATRTCRGGAPRSARHDFGGSRRRARRPTLHGPGPRCARQSAPEGRDAAMNRSDLERARASAPITDISLDGLTRRRERKQSRRRLSALAVVVTIGVVAVGSAFTLTGEEGAPRPSAGADTEPAAWTTPAGLAVPPGSYVYVHSVSYGSAEGYEVESWFSPSDGSGRLRETGTSSDHPLDSSSPAQQIP